MTKRAFKKIIAHAKSSFRRRNANYSTLLQQIATDSGLFDAIWYTNCVGTEPRNPWAHYVSVGWLKGFSPSATFDARYYLREYGDVTRANVNPLTHFLKFGALEGRRFNSGGETFWTVPSKFSEDVRSAMIVVNYLSKANNDLLDISAEDYAMVVASGLFDAAWYASYNPDLPRTIDLLRHYLDIGWTHGLRPNKDFDSGQYILQWLRYDDPPVNPFLHYVKHRQLQALRWTEIARLKNVAQKAVNDALAFEPELTTQANLANVERLSFVNGYVNENVFKIVNNLYKSLAGTVDHLVLVPWLVHGGADLVALNLMTACRDIKGKGSTLLLVTDVDSIEAVDWLPERVHVLGAGLTNLSFYDRVEAIKSVLWMLRPRSAAIVNSRAGWEAVANYGPALAQATDLYGFLFCRDFDAAGISVGYADRYFRRCLPSMRRIYFDNQHFRDELAKDFGLPSSLQERLVVLPQPVNINMAADRQIHSKIVLWASRPCRQKNVDLAIRIAQEAKDFRFDFYGTGDTDYEAKLLHLARSDSRIRYNGPFSRFESIAKSDFALFLYTSLWDGIPNVLLSAAACGLPIVAPDVGGISELVDGQTGWLIEEINSVDAYCRAMDEIINNPSEVAFRKGQMCQRLQSRHSWSQYLHALREPPSFLD
jgi:glycosyltransferase involved in cell wall biosynthesis